MRQPLGPLPRILVFGVKGFPETDPQQDPHYVALLPRLSALAQATGYRLHDPLADVRVDVQEALQQEVESTWETFCELHTGGRVEDQHYEFVTLMSNVILWRWMIQESLAHVRPTCVILPEECGQIPQPVSSVDALLAWLPYQILAEECALHSVVFAPESIPEPIQGVTSWRRVGVELSVQILRVSVRGLMQMSGLIHFTHMRLKYWWLRRVMRNNGSSFQRVLLVSQWKKAESLLKRRRDPIVWHHVAYGDLNGMMRDKRVATAIPALREHVNISEQVVYNFLGESMREVQQWETAYADNIARDWRVLVTDGQHSPLVRSLIRKFINAEKPVGIIPEGAISYVGQQARYGGDALFFSDRRVTRFVLDEQQANFWRELGVGPEGIFISGFLGDTNTFNSWIGKVGVHLLDYLLAKTPESHSGITVLLSFDAFFWNHQVARFGQPGQSEVMQDLLRVLDALIAGGHRTLVKCRDKEVERFITQRFQGRAVLASSSIPWQILRRRCQIVVTRDSSVGWEALSLGTPVLVWNFSDYDAHCEITLQGFSPEWVQVARSDKQINTAVGDLISALSDTPDLENVERGRTPCPLGKATVVEEWLLRQIPQQ